MKTFWILIVLFQNNIGYVKSYQTLQECQTYQLQGEYIPLFLSPVNSQIIDTFCMSNRGEMKSLHGDVT